MTSRARKTRGGDADKVAALDRGADDYLAQPFSLRELRVRVCVTHIRRAIGADPSHPSYLLTEVGVGYRLHPPDEVLGAD